ncbi:MAG: helix-turn-helix transcriptional regulator [Nitrospira sp.]|nr:helix-turn-helix transcriptional regulator [Nitrospira sp.]
MGVASRSHTHYSTERPSRKILIWVVQGKTNSEIGTILGISPRTVHKHLGRIYVRLGVENRHAAMALVMEMTRQGYSGNSQS